VANQYKLFWKNEEIDYLRNNYGKMFNKEIAIELNKSVRAVCHKAMRLGFNSFLIKAGWTNEEKDYLRNNYGIMFGKDIAIKLNRTYFAIRRKAERLGLYAPLSDFKNNNPMKLLLFKEKNRQYQKNRWADLNSVLNSEEYKNKQIISIKKLWKKPEFLKKMKYRDEHCKNKGKIRTEEMRKHLSMVRKANPDLMNYKPMTKKNRKANSIRMKKRWKNDPIFIKKVVQSLYKGTCKNQTSYEFFISDLCIKNNLPFVYTGDGTFLIGRKNPDFVNKEYRLAIEVFSDFYKLRTNKDVKSYKIKRRKYFAKYGYKVLFLGDEIMKKKSTRKEIAFNRIKSFLEENDVFFD